MPQYGERIEKTLLIGMAVEKSQLASRRWLCVIAGANGQSIDLPFVKRAVFKGSRIGRVVVDAPGPFMIEGKGSDDFELSIRLTAFDRKQVKAYKVNVPMYMQDQGHALSQLVDLLSAKNLKTATPLPIIPPSLTRTYTRDGSTFDFRLHFDTILIDHPGKSILQALLAPVTSPAIPSPLDEKIVSAEFYEECQEHQLSFLSSVIDSLTSKAERMSRSSSLIVD